MGSRQNRSTRPLVMPAEAPATAKPAVRNSRWAFPPAEPGTLIAPPITQTRVQPEHHGLHQAEDHVRSPDSSCSTDAHFGSIAPVTSIGGRRNGSGTGVPS